MEAALIIPILVLLLFGIIEMAMLMRDHVATTSAVRAGARTASAEAWVGPGTPASAPKLAQDAADAIARAGSAMPKDSIDELWVYKANTDGFPGTLSSLDGLSASSTCTSANNCVWYHWDDATNKFVFRGGGWVSWTINACVNSNLAQSVGVYMKATHNWITGILGGSGVTVADRAVMKFEPLASDQCNGNGPTAGGHI